VPLLFAGRLLHRFLRSFGFSLGFGLNHGFDSGLLYRFLLPSGNRLTVGVFSDGRGCWFLASRIGQVAEGIVELLSVLVICQIVLANNFLFKIVIKVFIEIVLVELVKTLKNRKFEQPEFYSETSVRR